MNRRAGDRQKIGQCIVRKAKCITIIECRKIVLI